MGHSQTEKAQSRERIVVAASRQIREAGLDGLNIGTVMAEAGLTHGGFYNHFESRDALVTAALAKALSRSKVVAEPTEDRRSLDTIVSRYLSKAHRDNPATACAVSGLASEVVRADDETRAVMDAHLQRYIANIAESLPPGADPALTLPVTCTMIGALTLSRLMNDAAYSDKVLEEARDFILSLAQEPKQT
jgi:TetR/AcrR family transcriptional repressor of nem operon